MNYSGKEFSFWSGGMTVYGVCVLLANLLLVKMTNNYTGGLELIAFVQSSLFWFAVYIENHFTMFTVLYMKFDEFVSSVAAWLGIILVVTSIYTIDIIWRSLYELIINFNLRRKRSQK